MPTQRGLAKFYVDGACGGRSRFVRAMRNRLADQSHLSMWVQHSTMMGGAPSATACPETALRVCGQWGSIPNCMRASAIDAAATTDGRYLPIELSVEDAGHKASGSATNWERERFWREAVSSPNNEPSARQQASWATGSFTTSSTEPRSGRRL